MENFCEYKNEVLYIIKFFIYFVERFVSFLSGRIFWGYFLESFFIRVDCYIFVLGVCYSWFVFFLYYVRIGFWIIF